MSKLLFVDNDACAESVVRSVASRQSVQVWRVASGKEALSALANDAVTDIVVTALRLPDMSGLTLVRSVLHVKSSASCIVMAERGNIRQAVAAIRLGAYDVLDKPLEERRFTVSLLRLIRAEQFVSRKRPEGVVESHASSRWARAIVPLVDAPSDPRTLDAWAKRIAASAGALRNWCYTARVSPRRSLLFARMLRAFLLVEHQGGRLEDVLDVVDRRTLHKMMVAVGINEPPLPKDVWSYIDRQILVRDANALRELRRCLVHVRPETAGSRHSHQDG